MSTVTRETQRACLRDSESFGDGYSLHERCPLHDVLGVSSRAKPVHLLAAQIQISKSCHENMTEKSNVAILAKILEASNKAAYRVLPIITLQPVYSPREANRKRMVNDS